MKTNSNSNHKGILIIEDEVIIRETLKMLLELAGYSVATACNGKEGLESLQTAPHPSLIILDLLMPVMNGMEFLDVKSHNEAIASIPVCVISGVAEKPVGLKAVAFIKKPLDFEVLLKMVKQYCESRK